MAADDQQWISIYMPRQETVKQECVSTPIVLETPPDDISLYIGANIVGTARGVEIVNAWRFLFNGIKDRNLLDDQFKGALLYTYVDINDITANNRRTSSDLTGVTSDDVVIGLGLNVTAKGQTQSLASGVERLIEYAMETTLKVS